MVKKQVAVVWSINSAPVVKFEVTNHLQRNYEVKSIDWPNSIELDHQDIVIVDSRIGAALNFSAYNSNPTVLLIFDISCKNEMEAVRLAFKSEIRSFVITEAVGLAALEPAIRSAITNDYYIGGVTEVNAGQFVRCVCSPPSFQIAKFSLAERAIINCFKLNPRCSNKEIAKKLGRSVSTVKNHLHRIYEKAGVKTRTNLVDIVARNEL